ncbi:GerAB/ArcD/ProY family transporter [Alkalihalobacillus sp. LMS39]|uniref:GerAB/ArcD/ProY family transporter n=1 Tax=Alkalihalobacillus sp. LMS39 TaxID=2924032 RepID=UPI001FB499FB|nr:GerAB/ArcD/ProY family transporter [Alkalihalobacillus sp. LMS39]UOE92123.1 spore germination protein [Alkalihalobacillus sp. LMS39]
MKVHISHRQLGFLAANMTIASSLVVLPQSLTDLSLQNTWVVPLFLFAYVVILVSIGMFGIQKLQVLDFDSKSWKIKGFALLMFIFIAHILIRDVRILTGFVDTTLLPLTPTFVVTMLFIGTSLYIAWAGIEVIARFNEIMYVLFIIVILFIPISLFEEMSLANFEPVMGFHVIPSLLQSSFIGFAWIGEIIIVFLILNTTKSYQKSKLSLIWGGGLGLFLLFILIFSQTAVIGSEIVRFTTYPSYTLVQQIRLTEFLDRLDFFLVSLYFPTIFSKLALMLYGLNRSVNMITNSKNKVTLIPLTLLMGMLSLLLFEDKNDIYEFKIHSWASLGLFLQLVIAIVMFLIIRDNLKNNKQAQNNSTQDSEQ